MDHETIWEIIKTHKSKYITENINKMPNKDCMAENIASAQYVLSPDDEIEYHISTIEDIIRDTLLNIMVKYPDNIAPNINKEDLRKAGQMFIYLSFCPRLMYGWTQMYINLFKKASPNIIVQTLNRILITGKLKKDNNVVNLAESMLMKVDAKFSLQWKSIENKLQENRTSNDPNQGEKISTETCHHFMTILYMFFNRNTTEIHQSSSSYY